MEPGMFLELNSASDCKLYGTKGKLLTEVRIDNEIPVLASGENQVSFSGKGTQGINSRIQVTVIHEGDPLETETPGKIKK